MTNAKPTEPNEWLRIPGYEIEFGLIRARVRGEFGDAVIPASDAMVTYKLGGK